MVICGNRKGNRNSTIAAKIEYGDYTINERDYYPPMDKRYLESNICGNEVENCFEYRREYFNAYGGDDYYEN